MYSNQQIYQLIKRATHHLEWWPGEPQVFGKNRGSLNQHTLKSLSLDHQANPLESLDYFDIPLQIAQAPFGFWAPPMNLLWVWRLYGNIMPACPSIPIFKQQKKPLASQLLLQDTERNRCLSKEHHTFISIANSLSVPKRRIGENCKTYPKQGKL